MQISYLSSYFKYFSVENFEMKLTYYLKVFNVVMDLIP